MCGIWEHEDWRDDLWGAKQDYPATYLRISEPEVQLMIHHPFDDKICDVAKGHTTNACVEYFNIKNSRLEKFNTISGNIHMSTRYVNYHKDFLKPNFVGFTKLDD